MGEFMTLQCTPVRAALSAARKGTHEGLLTCVDADMPFQSEQDSFLTSVTPTANRMLADMKDNDIRISVVSWRLSAPYDEAYSRCDRMME